MLAARYVELGVDALDFLIAGEVTGVSLLHAVFNESDLPMLYLNETV